MTTTDPLLERLRHIDTTCLSDADKSLHVLPPTIRRVVPGNRMVGRAVTAEANEDLRSVMAGLEQSGPGDVLVVAGGGDTYAVAGDLFATEAMRRGVAGIVIDGLCRDTATLAQLTIPMYARGHTPQAAPARGRAITQVIVVVGGVAITPGDVLVGDADGVIVGTHAQLAAAIDGAEQIRRNEAALRESMASGASLFDQLRSEGRA